MSEAHEEPTTPLIGSFKQEWLKNEALLLRETHRLIDLWRMHSDRPWSVPAERHGTNVALVSAYVNQVVGLSVAVSNLYKAGLSFEALPLIRSTMELAMTASWLAVVPEKTPDFIRASAAERKVLLEGIVKHGFDSGDALTQVEETLERFGDNVNKQGRVFKDRCSALDGGSSVYLMHRAISALCHPSNTLADAYTDVVDTSEENPWGLILRGNPENELSVNWLGINLALLLRAQIAADMVLTSPRHKTQLSKLARRMGVTYAIEAAQPGASGSTSAKKPTV